MLFRLIHWAIPSGLESSEFRDDDDKGWAIIQTSDGGYLAVGSGWNGILYDLLMVRMD